MDLSLPSSPPPATALVSSFPTFSTTASLDPTIAAMFTPPSSVLTPCYAEFYCIGRKLSKEERQSPNGGNGRRGRGGRDLVGKHLIPLADVPRWLNETLPRANTALLNLWLRPVLRDSAEQLVGSWVAWCDLDLKDNPEARQMIERFTPKPTLIVWSGGGYHAYWLLKEFCTDLVYLEAVNQGLVVALNGDRQAAFISKGLRVPGNINTKYLDAAPEVYTSSIQTNATAGSGRPVAIEDLPALEKKRAIGRPSNFRALYLRWFPDYATPEKPEWNVLCPWHDDTQPSMQINVENGMYVCFGASCGAKGSAISFLARMEGIAWKEARKVLDHLKVRAGLIDLIENHLRTACTPLYRERAAIAVLDSDKRFHRFHTGSRSQIVGSVQAFLDGSPAQQVSNAIGDDIDTENLNKLISEATLQLGQNLPDISSMTLLGEGVHYLEDRVIRVSGGLLARWDKDTATWSPINDLPYDRVYLPHHAGDQPAPWHPAPSGDYTISPTDLFRALYDMLTTGWSWQRQETAAWLAAYTLYLTHWQAFDTSPIHLSITGESHSGKSTLTEGWLSGREPGTTCMACGTVYRLNTSAAAIYQTMDRSTRPLVVDELLDHNNRRTESVLELLRNMETGGSQVDRGTPDGSHRKIYNIMFPTILSSIKTADAVQDYNRRLHIRMKKVEPPPPNPWQVIQRRWDGGQVEAIRAACMEFVPRNLDALRATAREVETEVAAVVGGAWRMARRMIPLLAIVRVCGFPTNKLMEDMLRRVREAEETAQASSHTAHLRVWLLTHVLHAAGYDGETTVMREIGNGGPPLYDAHNHGVVIWRDRNELGVLPHALRVPFDLPHGYPTLVEALESIPGWNRTEDRVVLTSRFRMVVFDTNVLCAGVVTPEQPEVTEKPVEASAR